MVWAACAPPRHPQKTPSRGERRDHGQGEAAAEHHHIPHRLHQRHSHAPRPVAHVNPITPPHAPSQPPSQMPMHSPTTAPTKLAGPPPAAIKPHQTPQQLQAARGHVLRAAGASGAAEGPQQHQHQHQQAPTRAPPLATFWAPTHPQTRLQAPPEPPVHAGSGGARGGRRWSRCCCVFAHVAAAACRARTHGSPGHNFSTAIAVSEVLKPLRAPLARGFGAENMTPEPRTPAVRSPQNSIS